MSAAWRLTHRCLRSLHPTNLRLLSCDRALFCLVQLYFVGPVDTGVRLLNEAGVLNPEWLDKTTPSAVFRSRAHLNQGPETLDPASIPGMPATGVIASTFANYYEAIMRVRMQ